MVTFRKTSLLTIVVDDPLYATLLLGQYNLLSATYLRFQHIGLLSLTLPLYCTCYLNFLLSRLPENAKLCIFSILIFLLLLIPLPALSVCPIHSSACTFVFLCLFQHPLGLLVHLTALLHLSSVSLVNLQFTVH